MQVPEVDSIAAGSFKQREPPEIRASGYVVHSLEAVLWAFYHTENFKDGCLKVGASQTNFKRGSRVCVCVCVCGVAAEGVIELSKLGGKL